MEPTNRTYGTPAPAENLCKPKVGNLPLPTKNLPKGNLSEPNPWNLTPPPKKNLQFSRWSAGCGCHGDHATKFSDASKKDGHYQQRPFLTQLIGAHYGPERKSCPMAGRRAPELANGLVQSEVVAKIFAEGLHNILSQMDCRRTDDLAELVSSFQIAKAELIGMLSMKLDFWRRWPWVLAGVAASAPRDDKVPWK